MLISRHGRRGAYEGAVVEIGQCTAESLLQKGKAKYTAKAEFTPGKSVQSSAGERPFGVLVDFS
jgi:hypothetical protein